MDYYIVKTDNQIQKTYLMGKYGNKGEALEALYIMLQEFEKSHQVILERLDDNDKVNVYKRNPGIFISTKDLICWFQITQIEKKESNFTKILKKDGSKKI